MEVVYLSGGIGKRANLGYPKQLARIAGKPIIIYGLEVLNKIDEINKIIIPTSNFEKTNKILNQYNINKNIELIDNGETRQESVYKALKYIKSEYVLIMESVRPFVTVDFVNKIINTDGYFIVPRNISVATVICDNGNTIDRNIVGEVQMPQKYFTDLLIKCHELAIKENNFYTDDSQLVINKSSKCNYNVSPQVIEGIEQNIKITTPLDLRLAEGIYEYYNNRE